MEPFRPQIFQEYIPEPLSVTTFFMEMTKKEPSNCPLTILTLLEVIRKLSHSVIFLYATVLMNDSGEWVRVEGYDKIFIKHKKSA